MDSTQLRGGTPLVSVVIPVYNGARYLAEAVASVQGQRGIAAGALEVVIIDDGSTDGTAEVAATLAQRDPRVRWMTQPNVGAAAARNRGVEMAHGAFIAFLDADDLWTDDKLSGQLAAFEAEPALDAVFGLVEQFYTPERAEELARQVQLPTEPIAGYVPGTILARRKVFARVGMFESRWRVGEGIDWYLRARDAGLAVRLQQRVILRRRIHDDNMGRREQASATDYIHIIKAALDRRRSAESARHRQGE